MSVTYRIEWKTPPSVWITGTQDWIRRLYITVHDAWTARLPAIESWMRNNATWTDRTGNARRYLNTAVYPILYDWIVLQIAHGVPYGTSLETVSLGKFQILTPTIDHWGPILMDDVIKLMR